MGNKQITFQRQVLQFLMPVLVLPRLDASINLRQLMVFLSTLNLSCYGADVFCWLRKYKHCSLIYLYGPLEVANRDLPACVADRDLQFLSPVSSTIAEPSVGVQITGLIAFSTQECHVTTVGRYGSF